MCTGPVLSVPIEPHLGVGGESSLGLGSGHSALGCSAVLSEAGGSTAEGDGGLGVCHLVQRQLESFILSIPTEAYTYSMDCRSCRYTGIFLI